MVEVEVLSFPFMLEVKSTDTQKAELCINIIIKRLASFREKCEYFLVPLLSPICLVPTTSQPALIYHSLAHEVTVTSYDS